MNDCREGGKRDAESAEAANWTVARGRECEKLLFDEPKVSAEMAENRMITLEVRCRRGSWAGEIDT